jgi:hypothetical protein
MELKAITAALMSAFKAEVAPTMTEDDMALTDHFLAIPKCGRCDLVFTPT